MSCADFFLRNTLFTAKLDEGQQPVNLSILKRAKILIHGLPWKYQTSNSNFPGSEKKNVMFYKETAKIIDLPFELLSDTLYSPDLAVNNFYLYAYLKKCP